MFGDGSFVDIWSGSYTDALFLGKKEQLLEKKLRKHVEQLAGSVGPRNIYHAEALEKAALYIEQSLIKAGMKTRLQRFQASDSVEARNIEATILGRNRSASSIVVGAHYDTFHDSPGANDNASAVAALIEIAADLAQQGPAQRTIRFVAFANEEPPYFGSDDMGSWVYAKELLQAGEDIIGMLCLECLGYYTTKTGSQQLPDVLRHFYSNDIGNFIAFLGNPESSDLVKTLIQAFRKQCRFPSEGLAIPTDLIPDITLSDNRSFWKAGFQSVMVTDTVYSRYKLYHTTPDTPDKLVYPEFATVTAGLSAAIRHIIEEY